MQKPRKISFFGTSEVISYSLIGFSNWDAISQTMRPVEFADMAITANWLNSVNTINHLGF